MKKYLFFVLISTTIYSQDLQNNKNLDSLADIFSLEEVTVNALRAQKDTPVPFINISKKDLEKVNLAQDLPTLLKNTPSVLTTSDSGSGIGYSSIRVRGSDQSRVNVTINGIPYNDSESMSVYWVNLPDFASSIESIQIQRGLGSTSLAVPSAGGTVSVNTRAAEVDPGSGIKMSVGDKPVWNPKGYNIREYSALILHGNPSKRQTIQEVLSSKPNVPPADVGVFRYSNAVTDIVGTAATITTIDATEGDIVNAKITAGVVTSLVGTYATITTVDIETLDAKTTNITGLAVTDIVGTAATITTIDATEGDIVNAKITAGIITDIVGTAVLASFRLATTVLTIAE